MISYIDKQSFADAQIADRVFILRCKHAGMVSLSYFENQILTLETLLIDSGVVPCMYM